MRFAIFILLGITAACLPTNLAATITQTIHAEWSSYPFPAGYTVIGYALYMEGRQVCRTDDPWATSINCTITLNAPSAAFTLTALFSDGTLSPHSAPFTFSTPTRRDTPSWNLESGEVSVTHRWTRVTFASPFKDPVVVAGPPGYANAAPCTLRLRNISRTGFEIRLTEWNYLDGIHPAETVNFLAIERGRTTLPNGLSLEANRFSGSTQFNTVRFSTPFSKKPVILTAISSSNEAETIGGRIKNISTSGFAYAFREQEASRNTHAQETIQYIAWEPGTGTIGSIRFEAATTYNRVDHYWFAHSFKTTFPLAPMVVADMQTVSGTDSATLRVQRITTTGFKLKTEEEQSADKEVWHPAETVGYLALGKVK